MTEDRIILQHDDYLGAVRLNGDWHLLYGPLKCWRLNEWLRGQSLMRFDYASATRWIETLKGEIKLEQARETVKNQDDMQAPLNFLVNFDDSMWVGMAWEEDVPMRRLQPQGWTAIEGDVYHYLPVEMRGWWSIFMLKKAVVIYADNVYLDLFHGGTGLPVYDTLRFPVNTREQSIFSFTLGQMHGMKPDEADFEELIEVDIDDFPLSPDSVVQVVIDVDIRLDRALYAHVSFSTDEQEGIFLPNYPRFGPFPVD